MNEDEPTVLLIPIEFERRAMLTMPFDDTGLFQLFKILDDITIDKAVEFAEMIQWLDRIFHSEEIVAGLRENGVDDPSTLIPELIRKMGQELGLLDENTPAENEQAKQRKVIEQKRIEQQLVKFSYHMLEQKRYRNRVDVARLASRTLGRQVETNTWTQRVNRWAQDRLPKIKLRKRSGS